MYWELINALFALAVFYMSYCRLSLTTAKVHWWVRWVIAYFGTIAVAWALAPILWPHTVHIIRAAFTAGAAGYLLATSPLWLNGGTPRELHRDKERRTGPLDRRGST